MAAMGHVSMMITAHVGFVVEDLSKVGRERKKTRDRGSCFAVTYTELVNAES